jgi:DNA-binding PadR family transcriptional regulator
MFRDRFGSGDWGDDWQPWGRHRGRGRDRRERVFGRGDLKYVILDLLKDQPRHGYDIIRELEGRLSGMYTPSAGAVYPTLQMLEDMGAVAGVQEEGRKVYTITAEGRRILEERKDTVDAIADRVRDWMHGDGASELHEIMRELASFSMLVGREGRRLWKNPTKLRQIRKLITRTGEELRAILHDEASV